MTISGFILYCILGIVTSAAGLQVDNWSFWAILLLTLAIDINSHRQALKAIKNGK